MAIPTSHAPGHLDATTPAPRRRRGRRVAGYLAGGLVTVVAIGWAGLQIQPAPLPPPDLTAGDVATIPLPDDLPPPVERFYRTVYGDEIPIVTSAVVTGRGTMRVSGITFPARFRFSQSVGEGYRHYIEVTIFGRELLTVNEWFQDGSARLELPFGVMEGPEVDQGGEPRAVGRGRLDPRRLGHRSAGALGGRRCHLGAADRAVR